MMYQLGSAFIQQFGCTISHQLRCAISYQLGCILHYQLEQSATSLCAHSASSLRALSVQFGVLSAAGLVAQSAIRLNAQYGTSDHQSGGTLRLQLGFAGLGAQPATSPGPHQSPA